VISTATAGVSMLGVIVGAAARRGVEPEALLNAVGLTTDILARHDVRVPQSVELALWDAAVRQSGDEALPLHAAAELRPGDFGVIDYAARASRTLGEALARLVRYHRLIHSFVRLTILREDGVARIQYATLGESLAPSRARSDFALASLVVVGRQLAGLEWAPRAVCFQHAPPANAEEHRRLFRAPVDFGAVRDEIVVPAPLLERPVLHPDPGLTQVLDRYATELLQRLPAESGVRERVKWLVGEALAEQAPRATHVARALRVSPRHLQRCLAREGTSFGEVRDELRRELAERYLREGLLSLAQVATRLGFSSHAAFHRAFRRWTGMTPGDFRRECRRRG
jgi:AraC-like DNA-binding protein